MFLKLIFLFIILLFTFCAFAQVEVVSKIEFFNKKVIEGKLVFASSNVNLSHVVNQVIIQVSIPFVEIEFIHPVTWLPELQSVRKDRSIVYNFYPIEYLVKLKDGTYLNVVGRVKEFEVIDFVHKYGKSKIYTYYVDYLVFDKVGNTKWKNMNTYELNKNFKKPHPNVAYFIYMK